MNIPNSLLLTYQAEYEINQELTIEQLCENYGVTTKDLRGYTKWTKRQVTIVPDDIIDTPGKSEEPQVVSNPETLLKDIDTFKSLAMAHTLKFMRNDAEYAEVKEFKDIVSIVSTLEVSLKDTKPENTINIAIQNIVRDFKDDC